MQKRIVCLHLDKKAEILAGIGEGMAVYFKSKEVGNVDAVAGEMDGCTIQHLGVQRTQLCDEINGNQRSIDV